MGLTPIEWTDLTWTPLRAKVKRDAGAIAKAKGYTSLVQIAEKMAGHVGPHCERVSPGCENCYSENNNGRCLPENGTGLPFDRRARDLVDPFVDQNILLQPLHWRRPRKIFAFSQTDFFGEWFTNAMRYRVIAVAVVCQQHTFQFLTKRSDEMHQFIYDAHLPTIADYVNDLTIGWDDAAQDGLQRFAWPLRNIHLGVSVENQATADERIPLLLQTPAAVRFVSYEPALGPVDFYQWIGGARNPIGPAFGGRGLDQIIVGGESGPGARPFDIYWARQTIEQCKAAGVAVFVKQLGAQPFNGSGRFEHQVMTALELKDRKGGKMDEWPEWARVREFPVVRA